jgi:hypothetical protein
MSEIVRDDLFASLFDCELRDRLGDEVADVVHKIGARVGEMVRNHERYILMREARAEPQH